MSTKRKFYEKKYFPLKALDIDTSTKSVKVAIAEMETKDLDGDIITPDAFNRTIKAKGPQGSNEIWHLLDHTPTSFSALSKFSELYVEGKYLVGVSKYKNSFAWREVAWPLYESGDFTQHSIGFRIAKADQKSDYQEIQEVELFEGSAVLWGANPNTPTLDVVKLLSKSENGTYVHFPERIRCPKCSKDTANIEAGMGYIKCSNCENTFSTNETAYMELHSKLERLLKFIHSSNDLEENRSLIEIEFRQIQQQLSDLKNTSQHVGETLDTVKKDDELLRWITQYNNNLK